VPSASRQKTKAKPAARKPAPAPKAAPKKAAKPAPKPSPKKSSTAKPKPASPSKPSPKQSAPAAPIPVVRRADGRVHVLSLSFVRDGDEFMARMESDAGQITELKNRSLDQLLTLVASELEDLLE
jgi:hypothetical protein